MSTRWTIIGLAIAALGLGLLTSSVTPRAWSFPDFFSSRCASCHTDDTPSCVGCHHHRGTLNATTDLTEYPPGAAVTVTFTGGTRGGWIRALLYDQNNVEIDRKTGPTGTGDDGQPNPVVFPVTLTGQAPAEAGTYTWSAAWFGNLNDGGATHGENLRTFTVRVVAPTSVPDQDSPTAPSTWGWIKGLFD